MNVGIVGVGKLGLVFALAFEQAGHDVYASSYRQSYVEQLQKGIFRTTEPGVNELLDRSSRLQFTTDNHSVIDRCDVIYVMVATPSLPSGDYDVSAVWEVVQDFLDHPSSVAGKTLVVGCTTNPGTCAEMQQRLSPLGVTVVYCPTFAAQGTVYRDIVSPYALLLGTEDLAVAKTVQQLFFTVIPPDTVTSVMGLTAAEICKLANNCRSTMLISYYNMIGQVLIESGLDSDIENAIDFLNHPKPGHRWKFGFGYGGPCFPRDNRSFVHYSKKLGMDFPLGRVVDEFNQQHINFISRYLIKENVNRLPFYFDHVSYKPGVAMFDESQQLQVCHDLLSLGHQVYVCPSQFLTPDIQDELVSRHGDLVAFQSIGELAAAGTRVFEIKL